MKTTITTLTLCSIFSLQATSSTSKSWVPDWTLKIEQHTVAHPSAAEINAAYDKAYHFASVHDYSVENIKALITCLELSVAVQCIHGVEAKFEAWRTAIDTNPLALPPAQRTIILRGAQLATAARLRLFPSGTQVINPAAPTFIQPLTAAKTPAWNATTQPATTSAAAQPAATTAKK